MKNKNEIEEGRNMREARRKNKHERKTRDETEVELRGEKKVIDVT